MAVTEFAVLIGMHRLVNEIDKRTARLARLYGLTLNQFAVLETLVNVGSMTIGDTQRKILSSTGTMPVIVGNLLRRGLIKRTVSEMDRRRVYLEATEEGREIIGKVAPKNVKNIVADMDCWTKEEKRELIRLFRKFMDYNKIETPRRRI